MIHQRFVCLGVLPVLAVWATAQVPSDTPAWLPEEYRYAAPFFPDAQYDAAVETPQRILGFEPGERAVTHAQVEKCLQAWARHPRMKLVPFGQTHERRTLYYAVITSEANHRKLDDIRTAIGKLADPRKLGADADADSIIKSTPAIAWMAYCIHGDEMSGTDAAVALVYHLLSATDEPTKALLDNLVVIVDPLMNPDGRDRFIKLVDECNGYTPNLDPFATQHAGRWPRGRTNHYFFDMNRDWIYATQPETQARQRAIVAWSPQLLVDGHEMGHESTFLFNPAREPFNPNLAPSIRKWWNTFADDAGAAFDRYGWSYYSREWADFWYPGYSDGWSTCLGTIGILYEQARTGGRPIRQPTGRILTYREAVHHQAICSLSNLRSLQKNREAVLRDFLAIKRAAVAAGVPAGRVEGETHAEPSVLPQTFILPPSRNVTRQRAFLDYLANQGVEVHIASQVFTASNVVSTLKQRIDSREFPAGTILVQRRQPLGTLVGALLDFDPRIDKAFLDSERRELETKRNSRLYDITGWSPPLAWGLEAYWSAEAVGVASKLRESNAAHSPTTALATQATQSASQPVRNASSMSADEKAYAYVIDSADDAIVRATAFLLQAGVQCRVAEKEFRAAGRTFPRGSLLVRRHENATDFLKRLRQATEDSGAAVHAASTARSPDDTPDLGGEYFPLLLPPRIALAGDGGGDANSFGALWHLLDREVGLSVSLVDNDLSGIDLRRFNVVITTSGAAVRSRSEELATWLRSGGTLIAIEGAASALADDKLKLSGVRRREDVLKQLEEYASAWAVERAAGRVNVDVDKLWDDVIESVPPGEKVEKPETKLTDEALEDWRQVFSPTGAIVRGELRTDHWLTWGVAVSSATRKAPLAPASAPASAPTSATSTASAPIASQPIIDAWEQIPLTFRAHELDGPLVEMPLFAQGSTVLLAKGPVQTPVRFAPAKSLRLSGLLWPEAAVRLGGSAAVTVERVGRGQLILFAQDPNFRAAWRGTRRLLLNAILLGPGCGTSPPAP